MQNDGVPADHTLGVIDIGSNSGRVLVARVMGAAHLEVVGDARSPLRLVRDVARRGTLTTETIDRTLAIVRGFMAIAARAGADRTVAVATAAVREATNGDELIDRARHQLGLEVDIADGVAEAQLGFLGAVHGLPIEHGIVLDVGGGSLQLVHFRNRRLERSWSVRLGALRLNDQFLKSDPPTRGEMRNLKQHVYETLQKAGVRPLLSDERLIGTGGTVRNLAKIDRRLLGDYPISRLHGYVLDRRRLDDVGTLVSTQSAGERGRVPGLNADRADSIVGGVLVVQSVMDRLLASSLTVAGYGLREGVALRTMAREAASVADVRAAAVSALGSQFRRWDPVLAERRAALAERLLEVLRPDFETEHVAAAACAARLMDVGASIDHYRRFAHSARIAADANLDGYAHRTVATISAALLAIGEREASVKGYAPLLATADVPVVEQIAAVVGLADALVRYGSDEVDHVPAQRSNGHVAVDTALVDDWPLDPATRRAERAFGVRLEIGAGAATRAN